MTNDGSWVEDVKRWYFAGREPVAPDTSSNCDATETFAIGYEAAHPSLQARYWPEVPAPVFIDPL
jgi:hypothetical protein